MNRVFSSCCSDQSLSSGGWGGRGGSRISGGGRRGLDGGGGGLGSVGLGRGLAFLCDIVVGLVGAVDGDLDGNLTAVNLLAVHLGHSLLLKLLGSKGDKAETTSLAGLVAGLELLDHETGDGAEGDLGGNRFVCGKDLLELYPYASSQVRNMVSYDSDFQSSEREELTRASVMS